MSFRRYAVVLAALPLACYIYACSSDPEETPAVEGEDGGTTTDEGGSPVVDGSTPKVDGSTTKPDGSTPTDGGDAGLVPCVGNPLLADGGTGMTALDAGVSTRIVNSGNGATFFDGPQWVPAPPGAGFLVYSEFETTEQLHRVAADGGAAQVFRTNGLNQNLGPIGNAFRNGLLVTAVPKKGGGAAIAPVLLLTAADGGAAGSIPIADGVDPNDLAIGKNGTIYFTDPQYQTNGNNNNGTRGVFQTLPDGGGATRFATFNGGERPNGIALSPDGSKLYVAFTTPKRIDSYAVAATGVVGAVATPFVLAAALTDSPDGLAVDQAGNVYVAEANANNGTQSGVVEVFKSDGTKWGSIPFPTTRPTGVAFGSTDDKTLFVTAQTAVYAYTGRCAGIR